ncbi:eukaryotic translation initiation factor 3 subunit 9-like protein [Naegleria gruberi]|uniref:Eukaryotic translation initiation factor 2A n=1 Tax=Naegleria gruberi TaxID=5762 RepID=D2VSS4_NAEGR|nr:eukaryotic translation initiation factor 3 subunit 9-like protein [Naegleria gruberi]EFC40246.1 eukaryotic translation initiation factor 3 subunit 9-like protein [Naegleria gruberi]|eukprot:XP_002672990.1 eukaryotic translation initiation factor 3 subunit 9-like protein [Naegleria gruberi strain NEG-M]
MSQNQFRSMPASGGNNNNNRNQSRNQQQSASSNNSGRAPPSQNTKPPQQGQQQPKKNSNTTPVSSNNNNNTNQPKKPIQQTPPKEAVSQNTTSQQAAFDEDAEGYKQMENLGVIVDEPEIQLVVNTKSKGICSYSVRYQDQQQSTSTADKIELIPSEKPISTQSSDFLIYSDDGAYLAYLDKIDPFSPNDKKISRLFISDTFTGEMKYILTQPREVAITKVHFSPCNSYLITLGKWNGEPSSEQDENLLKFNLRIWKLKQDTTITESGVPSLNLPNSTLIELNEKDHLLMKFSHKPTENGLWPVIQWNEDETLMAYFDPSEESVIFYNVEETPEKKISFQPRSDIVIQRKVHAFALSPKSTFAIYTYNTNKSTEQNSVRLYKLPNVKRPTATKHFSHDVDSVEMRWNKVGTALLVYTTTNTDQSDKSYYGENKLYYVRSNGNLSKDIQLTEEGPVHDLQWSPRGNEFVAIYGYSGPNMRATLFDAQSQPIFEFLQQQENTSNWKVNKIFYSPHGRFLVLAGFGGFTGTLLFFDRERKRLMGINQASEPTFAHWSPDSRLFIVGTHFPKLRVANKFQIYKYNGQLMYNLTLQDDFLYHAIIRPVSSNRYKNRPPSPRALNQGVVNGASSTSNTKPSQFQSQPASAQKVSAYVPPHLRGKTSDVPHGPTSGSNFSPQPASNANVKTVVVNIFSGKTDPLPNKNAPPPPNYDMVIEKKKKKRVRKRKKKKGTEENASGDAQGEEDASSGEEEETQ